MRVGWFVLIGAWDVAGDRFWSTRLGRETPAAGIEYSICARALVREIVQHELPLFDLRGAVGTIVA